jgi:uncharacterized membrane protein
MAKKQLMLAFFASETAADEAVKRIQDWDARTEHVYVDTIGILVKDEKGKIKTHKLGKRKTSAGVILGAIAGILTGGLSLVGGALIGGVMGHFMQKGLGLSKADLARINGELDGGKAAVGVLADPDDVTSLTTLLTDSGGVLEVHEVSDETIEQVEEAAQDTTEESAA